MWNLILPPIPKAVAKPERELRFTRMAQAPLFYFISAVAAAAALGIIILSTQKWGMSPPPMHQWWWLIIPDIFIGWWFLRLGLSCNQYAYLILTPLGLEIFPFFNARRNLQVIYWTQIAEVDYGSSKLTIHFSEQKNSGVIISLRPIAPQQRELLKKAIEGRMQQAKELDK